MPRNRGNTTLKRRNRAANPMDEYDRLPVELRMWMSKAILPWRAATVQRAYDKARARTGSSAGALAHLDRLQESQIAKDALKIWGGDHPAASV